MMWETDLTHPASQHPGPPGYAPAPAEVIRRDTEIVGEPVMRKVLHDNASRVYHPDSAAAASGWLGLAHSPPPAARGQRRRSAAATGSPALGPRMGGPCPAL